MDTTVTIGNAVEWNVTGALRHLETCVDCQRDVAVLRSVRAALSESEAIDDAALARTAAVVCARAQPKPRRWPVVLECVLAGITAPAVLVASGVPVVEGGALALAALLGTVLGAVGSIHTKGRGVAP